MTTFPSLNSPYVVLFVKMESGSFLLLFPCLRLLPSLQLSLSVFLSFPPVLLLFLFAAAPAAVWRWSWLNAHAWSTLPPLHLLCFAFPLPLCLSLLWMHTQTPLTLRQTHMLLYQNKKISQALSGPLCCYSVPAVYVWVITSWTDATVRRIYEIS